MKEVSLEGKILSSQGESVWTGKGGGFSAVAIPLGNVPGGNDVSEL